MLKEFSRTRIITTVLLAAILACGGHTSCSRFSQEDSMPTSCTTVQDVLSEHHEYLPLSLPENPPNIIILLVDALRPDHLGCYSYHRDTSPFIDKLAQEGTLFTNAFVHSTMTHPSTSCLFTGTIPPVNAVHEWADASAPGMVEADKLQKRSVTIAELLKKKGYSTAAFLANWHITPEVGYKQGFNVYKNMSGASASTLNQMAAYWITSLRKRPFFCYIHYMDVHMPYKAPPPYNLIYPPVKGRAPTRNLLSPAPITESNFLYTIGQYDGEIHYLDDQLRIFFSILNERGLLENTLVVLLADHGEEFLDHGGIGHALSLYDELLHVPLIFWYPGVIPAGVTREEMVMQSDILPTLASLVKVNWDELPVYGTSLFYPASSPESKDYEDDRILYAEVITYKTHNLIKAVRTCEDKLILTITNGHIFEREYYDLSSDPGEKNSLYSPNDPHTRLLEKLIYQIGRQKGISSKRVPLDEKHINELKSLGYLE
jgi:arylsulfatase A-like enzyme